MALAAMSAWVVNQVRSTRSRAEVAMMMANTRTVCVGRFLVNVPVRAEVALSHERIAGFQIDANEETEAAFRKRIEVRVRALEARKDIADDDGGLEETRDLRVAGMIGRAFIYGRSRGYLIDGDRRADMESVAVEVHGHKDGVSFSLADQNSSEERLNVAEALLGRLRLLRQNEVPAEQGFCIGRAVFAEPLPPHKTEHIAMHIGFAEHPDLAMAFDSMPGGNTSPDLLNRYAEMDADAGADEFIRVTKLRSADRNINGFAGQEVLERVHEFNFTTTYGFIWESRGAMDDPLKPFLSLELHGGMASRPGAKPVDSSLHEDALLALWDGVASSIRLRPPGPLAGETDSPTRHLAGTSREP